jgi:hypothetical protein
LASALGVQARAPPQNRLAREGNGKRWVEIWPGIFSIESETLGWMNDEWLKIA